MDWIEVQYHDVLKQKAELESLIDELKILFKPWPSKLKEATKDEDSKQVVEPQETKQPEMSVEEEQSLAMVNNLLKKANRAREIQKKLEKPTRTSLKESTVGKKERSPRSNNPETENSDYNSTEKDKDSKVNINLVKPNPVKPKSDSKSGVLNNKATNSKAVDRKPIGADRKTNPPDRKPNNANGDSKADSSNSVKSRSSLSERTKSSSGSRKLPSIHSNAPFHTNPNLLGTKMKTTYQATTAKTLAAKLKQTKASGKFGRSGSNLSKGTDSVSRTASSLSSTSGDKSDTSDSNDKKAEVVNKLEAEAVSKVEPVSDNKNNLSADNGKIDSDTNDKILDIDGKRAENDQAKDTGQNMSQDSKEKEKFRLDKDGASLKVPGKLKKLVYQNRKIRQKLYTQNVTQKVNTPPLNGCEFPSHLEHAFGDPEGKIVQLQAKQAKYLLNVYTNLNDLLDSLHLENISEDSDLADVYKAKVMMEYILTTFQETDELLHQADFRVLKQAVLSKDIPDIRLSSSQPPGSLCWYNNDAHCKDPPAVIQYSHSKHLDQYYDSMFHSQQIQLQIDSMDHIADTVIPLLQSLDPTSSEFVEVLRISYSLLSQDRHRMPVIIQDTIDTGQDDDEQW